MDSIRKATILRADRAAITCLQLRASIKERSQRLSRK